MENENKDIVDVDTDADLELDNEINATMSKIKNAEQPESANPTETVESKVEETQSSPSTESPSSEDTSPKESQTETQEEFDFRQPIQGKFESDASYHLRLQIAERIKERKLASNESEKNAIQKEIGELRKEFRSITINRSPSFNNDSHSSDVQSPQETLQDKIEVDPKSLEQIIEQKVQSERVRIETESVINTFFDKYKDFKDPDTKQVFIDFFDSNYKIDGKGPKEVVQTLELARSAMFRPTESIQEKVIKSAGVQEKVNAMQFPGGTIVRSGLTADQQQSVNELKATGMSEDRARALILED